MTAADAAIGKLVKEIRTGSGATQADIADAMATAGWTGWSQRTVALTESGKRPLRAAELAALAAAVQVDPIDILTGPSVRRRLARLVDRVPNQVVDTAQRSVDQATAHIDEIRQTVAEIEADGDTLTEHEGDVVDQALHALRTQQAAGADVVSELER